MLKNSVIVIEKLIPEGLIVNIRIKIVRCIQIHNQLSVPAATIKFRPLLKQFDV